MTQVGLNHGSLMPIKANQLYYAEGYRGLEARNMGCAQKVNLPTLQETIRQR